MRSPWNPFGFQLRKMYCFVVLFFLFKIHKCWSLNLEGLALLNFRASVESDPHYVFVNWNPDDSDPCMWSGVQCKDGNVQILDLGGLSLGGTLSPELGKLKHLKSLILCRNRFTGAIPKEFGELMTLEVLDLSSNNLSGMIPAELGQMSSLKCLLLCNNKFYGSLPLELENLGTLSEVQFDRNLTFAVDSGVRCLHRKFGHCIWQKESKQQREDSIVIHLKRTLQSYVNLLPWFFRKSYLNACGESSCESLPNSIVNTQHLVNFVRRRLLEESSNLPALPASGIVLPEPETTAPPARSSGSFPAIPKDKDKPKPKPKPPSPDAPANESINVSPPHPTSDSRSFDMSLILIIGGACLGLLVLSIILILACRKRGDKSIGPWKTGLSGQLQKAFVTGVPKLNRSELESACEDFSNIIDTVENFTVYKGTLSSGVEIAVASTNVKDAKDWSPRAEIVYRKKIETLSRVNHKNFVNLLGYCVEEEPFSRMMVFEYAPSGSLFDHLHVKEFDHLDWNARMRVMMGVAYCLEFMHELDPPVALGVLQSESIHLTDDNAAKVADRSLLAEIGGIPKAPGKDNSEDSDPLLGVDPETDVYDFGLLLLETISGKLRHSEKDGSILNWASQYLDEKRKNLTDPTLKTFKDNELNVVCEVIKACVQSEPKQRPTMKETISKLREVLAISPEAATPRASPLWWAELEILSVEAT